MDYEVFGIIMFTFIFVVGAIAFYTARKARKEREEHDRRIKERLAKLREESYQKTVRANSTPIYKGSTYKKTSYSTASDTRQMSNTDDDTLATMLLMNQISNNNMPIFVDTTPSYSYTSSSSDDSCSRSSYSSSDDSSSRSSSYSSYSSSDSSSSYDSGSSDSGSSSSSCD